MGPEMFLARCVQDAFAGNSASKAV